MSLAKGITASILPLREAAPCAVAGFQPCPISLAYVIPACMSFRVSVSESTWS